MSELIAITRLIEHDYEVMEPVTREPYDLVVIEPGSRRFLRAQVKTVFTRTDRDSSQVIYARKSNGEAYTLAEADVLIGVDGRDVYIVPNRGLTEYWRPRNGGANDWRLLRGQSENETEVSA